MIPFLEQHRTIITSLCTEFKVQSLYAFGSVLTEKFNKDSDLDFVVEFQPLDTHEYSEAYFSLLFAFEDFFKRDIDLVEEIAIRNPYFRQELEKTKQLIYEA